MHAELQEFFRAHAEPNHASAETLDAEVAALMKVGHAVQRQVLELKQLLQIAERAAPGRLLDFKFQHIHGTLSSLENKASAFVTVGRELAQDMRQLDAYMTKSKSDCITALALNAETSTGAT